MTLSPVRIGVIASFALHGAALVYPHARPARAPTEPLVVRLVSPRLEAKPDRPAEAPVAQQRRPGKRHIARKPRTVEHPAPAVPEPSPAPVAEASVAPQPPVAAAPEPLPASEPVFDAAYLENPPPSYPPMSRRLHEEGRVVLRVRVNTAGRADEVELRASSGFARLDDTARDTVKQWKFVPARRGVEPVPAWVLVPISFKLEG